MNVSPSPTVAFLHRLPALAAMLWALLVIGSGAARGDALQDMIDRFDMLSSNGNSNCSAGFMDAIPTMPELSMLQGSCCSPMDEHRYGEQLQGLVAYRDIPEIPVNPYDIPASQAAQLMQYDALVLSPDEEAAYQFAMENSDEKGPCCCQCWRWGVYSGLAKLLIHERGFTGQDIVDVWNLSNGCGGGAEHMHG